jgi:hypothetical protein
MKKVFLSLAAVAALGLGSAQVNAATIIITPSTPGVVPYGANDNSNCEPGCVGDTFGVDPLGLTLLYNAGPTDADGGSFADDYETTFDNEPNDPADATITWVGPDTIECPSCYLAIKDGAHTPSYYFYDLSNWNGTDTIQLTGFWPEQGAISHLSIWGGDEPCKINCDPPDTIPEPTSLALLGLSLLGASYARRRKQ